MFSFWILFKCIYMEFQTFPIGSFDCSICLGQTIHMLPGSEVRMTADMHIQFILREFTNRQLNNHTSKQKPTLHTDKNSVCDFLVCLFIN